jgi:hypothetical protein
MVRAATRVPIRTVSLSIATAALVGLATSILASLAKAAMITRRVVRSRRATGRSVTGSGSEMRGGPNDKNRVRRKAGGWVVVVWNVIG